MKPSAIHHTHARHRHVHGVGCGHPVIRHQNHLDYIHEGHLHSPHGGHFDEHVLEVSSTNPNVCTPEHRCAGHDKSHRHRVGCGHEAVPHGDHVDYLVEGHLHHSHGNHCDDHGKVVFS